jgi:hypothetical protein
LLFSKHFNLQSGGRLAGVKREIKTETTGSSAAYNFSVLKKVPEEPNFSVNRTALATNFSLKYKLNMQKFVLTENTVRLLRLNADDYKMIFSLPKFNQANICIYY